MEASVKEKKENKLLHRTEVVLEVKAKKNPSRKELAEKIAELEKTKKENIIVDKITREFGKEKATVTAKIYESNAFLKGLEPKYKIVKNFPELKEKKKKEAGKEEKEKKPEGKGAEAKKEEKVKDKEDKGKVEEKPSEKKSKEENKEKGE